VIEVAHEEDGTPEEHEGPDFSDWPRSADQLWKLVMDIEYCDRILAAMNGPVAQEAGREYEEGREFLREAGRQLRAQLGYLICVRYKIKVRDEEGASPFSGAGRPRAFGAERPPDPVT
jgi:hypothetical protein